MATDVPLAYAVGDPNFGVNPAIVHVAYTNNVNGATTTTLYGIDSNLNTLVRIGGPDGVPSPNDGTLFTIGPLGVNASEFGGFDIQPITNDAYAALRVNNVSNLYRIDLATGTAYLLGAIGTNTIIDGLTVGVCLTAAGVEISGRVLTPDGRGLRNALVTITDAAGNRSTVTTGSFGYYQFSDVESGNSVVISVSSKRYRFASRVVQVVNTLSDVDFVATE